MKKGTIWVIVTVVSAAALGLIFYANHLFYQEYLLTLRSVPQITVAKPDRAWIELDFGNKKRTFEGVVGNSKVRLNLALKSAAQEGGFSLKTKDGKLMEVANIGQRQGRWKVYKNGEETKESLNTLLIAAGDRYSFKLAR